VQRKVTYSISKLVILRFTSLSCTSPRPGAVSPMYDRLTGSGTADACAAANHIAAANPSGTMRAVHLLARVPR